MKPFLHSPALNSIHLGGKKNTSHCAFKLQHHLFHKRMTKEPGRRSSGIQIGKIDIKRRDGRWTNSGNKVLKKKKTGQSATEQDGKELSGVKCCPGRWHGGTVASKAEVMGLLCFLQSCLSTFPGKPVFQITAGSGVECKWQAAGTGVYTETSRATV